MIEPSENGLADAKACACRGVSGERPRLSLLLHGGRHRVLGPRVGLVLAVPSLSRVAVLVGLPRGPVGPAPGTPGHGVVPLATEGRGGGHILPQGAPRWVLGLGGLSLRVGVVARI